MLTQKIKYNFKRVIKDVNLAARVFTMLKNKIMKMCIRMRTRLFSIVYLNINLNGIDVVAKF